MTLPACPLGGWLKWDQLCVVADKRTGILEEGDDGGVGALGARWLHRHVPRIMLLALRLLGPRHAATARCRQLLRRLLGYQYVARIPVGHSSTYSRYGFGRWQVLLPTSSHSNKQ